jgi:SNF2 family DNA or RNA helicase
MGFRGSLHPYQGEAVDRFLKRKSLLLAYGPGTGKTVMAIAAAEKLLDSGEVRQVLVLCPASLKYQWRDKILQFTTPDRAVMVIDGTKEQRLAQFCEPAGITGPPDYIIHSYDSVIHDYDLILTLSCEMVILDEATAIKSFKAQRSKRIKKMFRHTSYRLALTATPIENRPEELYSIMQWVDDTVLGRYDLFDKAYVSRHAKGWIRGYKNLDVLRGRLERTGAVARKTRYDSDVRPYLPDVDEDSWTVPMDAKVFKCYQMMAKDMIKQMDESPFVAVKADLRGRMTSPDESTPDGKLMAMYMCTEMLLDHPRLLEWSAVQYEKDDDHGSAYANYIWKSGALDDLLTSNKLDLLMEKIDDLMLEEDSKIIVVSKYKYMLHLIGRALEMRDNFSFIDFNGDMSAKDRAFRISRFSSDPECRILLTSYAGGYGLDLYMADCLINYDLPWSAGMQDQINSRHIRASSEFDKVYIRNLITDDSVEGRKLRILERKGRIARNVLDSTEGETKIAVDDEVLRKHLEEVLTRRPSRGKIDG